MPRPKQFNPDTALDAAVNLFWRNGYTATSIQQLVAAMGINRFSLYDTFGDKHQLFVAALKRYWDQLTSQILAPLYDHDADLDQIKAFLDRLADRLTSPHGERGCLITNTAAELSLHDEEVRLLVTDFLAEKERLIAAALTRGQRNGAVRTEKDPVGLARLLLCDLYGLTIINKARRDPALVRQNISEIASHLQNSPSTDSL